MSVIIRGMRKFGGVRMRQIFTKPQYDQYLYALEYYSSNPEKIYRIDLSNGSETLIKEESLTQYANDFAVSSDNVIYAASYPSLRAYDGFTGNTLDQSSNIYRCATINKDGIIYAMNASNNQLDIYDRNDLSTTLYSIQNINDAGTANYTYASMDTNIDGDVYIGGTSADNFVHKYDASGNNLWSVQDTFSGGTFFVASTPDGGVVYLNNSDNSSNVRKLDTNGNQVWTSNSFSNRISSIDVDYDGNIFVISASNDFIGKLDSSGNIIWEKYQTSTFNPRDISCDLEGNFYVSGNPSDIYKFDNDGNQLWVTTLPTTEANYAIEVTGMSGSEKWG